jgi:thioredoxin 1
VIAYDTPIKTSAQNLERVLALGKPALLVFEIERCEPCTRLDQPLKELAVEFSGKALIVRVEDVYQGGLQARYNIIRVPTLILWKDGGELGRIEGAASKDALKQHLEYLTGEAVRPATASGPSQALSGARTGGDGASYPTSQPPAARSWEKSAQSVGTAPLDVSDATFERDVLRSPLPVLVDFWAPWCGPCRMVSPIVEELGREYAGRLLVAKVNTDENPARPSALNIRGIPTLIFFKNGREVDRIVGAAPKASLKQFIERNL